MKSELTVSQKVNKKTPLGINQKLQRWRMLSNNSTRRVYTIRVARKST